MDDAHRRLHPLHTFVFAARTDMAATTITDDDLKRPQRIEPWMDTAARLAAQAGPPSLWTEIYMQTIDSLLPEQEQLSLTWFQHACIAFLCDGTRSFRPGQGTDMGEFIMRVTHFLGNKKDQRDFIKHIVLPSIPRERFLLLRSALHEALNKPMQQTDSDIQDSPRIDGLSIHTDGIVILADMMCDEYERRAQPVRVRAIFERANMRRALETTLGTRPAIGADAAAIVAHMAGAAHSQRSVDQPATREQILARLPTKKRKCEDLVHSRSNKAKRASHSPTDDID
jgi:hypothetical protein